MVYSHGNCAYRPSVTKLPGITEEHVKVLKRCGIVNVHWLLVRTRTKKQRDKLYEISGIPQDILLSYANAADLMRVRGLSTEQIRLLTNVGCNTLRLLATRNPRKLCLAAITFNNTIRRLAYNFYCRKVTDWIEQAKQLPKVIQY